MEISFKTALALCAGMVLYLSSAGQKGTGNGGGQTLLSRTYDTLVAGEGYGEYPVSLSQWDPRLGKLVAVRLQARVTVDYGYTLRNVADSSEDSYTVILGRKDSLSSPVMSAPWESAAKDTIGTFSLDPGKWQWRTLSTWLNHNYDHTETSADRIEPFVGTGKIVFNWSPVTWTYLRENNSNSGYHYDAVVRDTARIALVYFYAAAAGEDQPAKNKLAIYPNPAKDFIHLSFSDPAPGDWQVSILATDGRQIQSTNYSKVNEVQVNFISKLPAGVYFARATELSTGRNYKKAFLIQ